MPNCNDERACSNCYSGQGLCVSGKQEFLKELTELSYKHDLVISVDADNGLMFVHNRDKDYLHCEGYREVISGSDYIEWCDA